jgi:ribulose-5-phosphate 4-epimerase/fuculose-1-phosphate aldolase
VSHAWAGEAELRRELVAACQVLYAAKAVGDGLGGHLSARVGEHILIKPRPVGWWKLVPEDLIVIDGNGARVDRPGAASGVQEWPIHARIYAARPEAQCVLHVHPTASTLMAALGIEIEPLDQDCAALTNQVPVLDNGAVSISTPARGDAVAAALSNIGAVLLKNHGVVVSGKSIAEVCVTALRIEKAAETMLRAAALAKLPAMSDEKKARILEARRGVESSAIAEERWRMLQDYYLRSDR